MSYTNTFYLAKTMLFISGIKRQSFPLITTTQIPDLPRPFRLKFLFGAETVIAGYV